MSAPRYRNAEQYGKRIPSNYRRRCRHRQGPTGLHCLRLGGWIYETRGGPDHLRWFWSFTVTCPMTRSDRVPTLEEAKAQFETAWRQRLAWAKLQEMP